MAAAIGGAIGGALAMFLISAAGSLILWQQFHVSTAAQSWEALVVVSVTNALWMMVEGATTGVWLTAWEKLRRKEVPSVARIAAILAFVCGTMAAQELPGLLITVTRHRYVVLLHEAFSLIMGTIGLWHISAHESPRRTRPLLLEASVIGLAMSVLLFMIGNGVEIVVSNWFLYAITAAGILLGIRLGQNAADASRVPGARAPDPLPRDEAPEV